MSNEAALVEWKRMRRLSRLAVLLVISGVFARDAQGQLPALDGWAKARPVDDAKRDPSLAAFRDTLLSIIARRDSAGLFARLSPTVIYNFGTSDGGPAGFFAAWRGRMPELWETLDDVLTHGGRMIENRFWAPWTLALPNRLDPESFLIVRDSNVIVRAKPDSLSPAVGTLSFDVVRGTSGTWTAPWPAVELRDGRVVYVPPAHIRSPMQWRMSLDRLGGRWVVGLLLAGD
jgi:hypothetical protein